MLETCKGSCMAVPLFVNTLAHFASIFADLSGVVIAKIHFFH